jgi:hypothetical protein
MGAIVKDYVRSLIAVAAAAAVVAAVMWVVIAILTFDLGAFLNSFN